MTYASATITGSATGPADLRTVIENLMTSQGNWEFVEAYTATTFNVRVWRNKAAGNTWGQNWYLAMITNTAVANNLIFKVFEDYTTGTKLGYRGATGNSVLDVASGSGYGNTGYAPENTNWNNNCLVLCPSSSFTYRVRVTANGVFAVTSSGLDFIYCGLFNPIWSHANEFPLAQWRAHNSTTSYAGLTRRPGASAASAGIFDLNYASTAFDNLYGKVGLADAMCGTRVYSSRLLVYMNNTATGTTERGRGWFDTDILQLSTDMAVAVGDTLAINGAPYVCIYDGGTSCVFLRTD